MLALPHLGNWDFAGAWLAGQGYTVTVVAEPLEPPELFEWFVETRRRLGMRVIALSPSAGAEALARAAAPTRWCACSATATSPATAWRWSSSASARPCPRARPRSRCAAARRCSPVGCYFRPARPPRIRILEPIDTARTGRIRDDVTRVTQELAAPVRGPHPRRNPSTGTSSSRTGPATARRAAHDRRVRNCRVAA